MKHNLDRSERKHRRIFAQNFLTNERIADAIVEAAHIQANETVLEIGPGRGVLTSRLALRAERIIALEKDEQLVEVLVPQFREQANVHVIQGDALTTNLTQVIPSSEPYLVVSNLPYNVATKIITNFVQGAHPPVRLIVMVQKEVADRMAAKPPHASLLSMRLALFSHVSKLFDVTAENFQPRPKVDSAVVEITTHTEFSSDERERIRRLLALGFAQPRKTLANNLLAVFPHKKSDLEALLVKNGYVSNIRAEQLALSDWQKLDRVLSEGSLEK